jgi:hypothetical protein
MGRLASCPTGPRHISIGKAAAPLAGAAGQPGVVPEPGGHPHGGAQAQSAAPSVTLGCAPRVQTGSAAKRNRHREEGKVKGDDRSVKKRPFVETRAAKSSGSGSQDRGHKSERRSTIIPRCRLDLSRQNARNRPGVP